VRAKVRARERRAREKVRGARAKVRATV